MTVRLRHDQECGEDGCVRPARRADLCVAHYLAASPAVKRTCDLLDRFDAPDFVPFAFVPDTPCPELKLGAQLARAAREVRELETIFQVTSEWDSLEVAVCCALETMFAAPAYGEVA